MFSKPIVILSLLLLWLSACSSSEQPQTVHAESVGCDASNGRCDISLEDGKVSLLLGPNVVPLKPFDIKVSVKGMEIQPPVIDFQMQDMEMGLNRYRLISKNREWVGTATLPVCTTSRTDWSATLEFLHAGKEYRLRFSFATQ